MWACPKTRIAHLIGRSPSVVCREIARHMGPDGQYRAEEAGKAARAARRARRSRLLDCDEVLRRRVISDLSEGHTPRQISGACVRRRVAHCPPWILLPTLTARLATRLSTRGSTPTPRRRSSNTAYACPRAGGCARNPQQATHTTHCWDAAD